MQGTVTLERIENLDSDTEVFLKLHIIYEDKGSHSEKKMQRRNQK